MSSFEGRTPIENLLVSGLLDWADAGWVCGMVAHSGVEAPDSLRGGTFGLMAEVLFQNLMVPGDIVEGLHVPWRGTAGEALERIVNEWLTKWGDDVPTPGAIVWLANTPRGDELAHAVLAREDDSR